MRQSLSGVNLVKRVVTHKLNEIRHDLGQRYFEQETLVRALKTLKQKHSAGAKIGAGIVAPQLSLRLGQFLNLRSQVSKLLDSLGQSQLQSLDLASKLALENLRLKRVEQTLQQLSEFQISNDSNQSDTLSSISVAAQMAAISLANSSRNIADLPEQQVSRPQKYEQVLKTYFGNRVSAFKASAGGDSLICSLNFMTTSNDLLKLKLRTGAPGNIELLCICGDKLGTLTAKDRSELKRALRGLGIRRVNFIEGYDSPI